MTKKEEFIERWAMGYLPNETAANNFMEDLNYVIDEASKLPEILEILKEAKGILQSLKLSMLTHPDHEPGSEFDDMTDFAQEIEDKIAGLIKQATNEDV